MKRVNYSYNFTLSRVHLKQSNVNDFSLSISVELIRRGVALISQPYASSSRRPPRVSQACNYFSLKNFFSTKSSITFLLCNSCARPHPTTASVEPNKSLYSYIHKRGVEKERRGEFSLFEKELLTDAALSLLDRKVQEPLIGRSESVQSARWVSAFVAPFLRVPKRAGGMRREDM